ncbi:MAG: dihydrolipoyl dehydrogenase [Spirochaetia bacterium]
MGNNYDVIILGAGPGGYVAAIRAVQLGLSACVVEKDKPGGVCLNIGCIPSKNLLHQAEVFRSIEELEDIGVKVDTSGLDYEKVWKNSRQASSRLVKGVQFLLKKNKVEYIEGEGRISTAPQNGPKEVIVKTADGERTVSGKNIIIATGSSPRELPGFEFDEETVLSSTGALMLKEVPKKLVILGAGAIGVEFAHIMNAFGSEVTLVEMLDQVLPASDPDISEELAKSFKKRGITIHTKTKASSMKRKDGGVEVSLEAEGGGTSTVEADKLLVVVGRAPNSAGIGLEELGIEPEKGFIPTGDYYETSAAGVYAIGDVINTPLLAHLASKEGEIVVEHIAGHDVEPRVPADEVPMAVYTEPQAANFGLTEAEAKEKGLDVSTASFPFRGVGKAVAVGSMEGFVKLVYDTEIHEILGAHIVGPEATELIHEILLAKKMELLPENVADMVHAHPTLSESVMETMKAATTGAIHM